MSTDAAPLPNLAQLPDDVVWLKALIAQLYGTIVDRDGRIQRLEQSLHLLVKRFQCPASEKIDPRQLVLFAAQLAAELDTPAPQSPITDAGGDPPQDEPPPRKKTPHGRGRVPDLLERREVIHDLTPEQKLVLGGEENLVCIGEDVTRKYEWTPSSVFVVEHHQLKYVRREASPMLPIAEALADGGCDQATSPLEVARPSTTLTDELAARLASPVIVAPRPPEPIPGGVVGPGLLAQVIVSKYGDHLPLYRLERIFARQGVSFSRQTLCDWCAGSAKLLTPLTELIREEVLASFVVHTDDTPVNLRDAHAKQKCQARFWTYLGDEQHRLTWFEFTTSRQRAGPDRVLAQYRGYLQADGYGGYDDYTGVAISAGSPILKVACWAHARRKFHDALRTEVLPAQIALARIGQLYKLEKELKQRSETEWRDLSIEARAALIAAERQLRAQPLLEEFHQWLKGQAEKSLPKSPLAIAVRYALNQWDGLCRYVDDGRLAIDNNAAERALRGIAIGRRNWMFCGSEAGGHTAAKLFTMIASATRNKLDPWLYLRDVLTRLPALGEKPSRTQLLPLLPDRWQPSSDTQE